METVTQAQARPTATNKILYMAALAFGLAFICKWLGTQAQLVFEAHVQSPLWRSVLGYYGIMIVLVTLAGLGLSLTPVARLEGYGASKMGYALLFIVLARIGAKGDLNAIREFRLYLLMGAVWILTHGAVLLFMAKRRAGFLRSHRKPGQHRRTGFRARRGRRVSTQPCCDGLAYGDHRQHSRHVCRFVCRCADGALADGTCEMRGLTHFAKVC